MTAFDDFKTREQTIWSPFSYSHRFSAEQITERATIYGLFSGTYLNGMEYLQAIDAFELALIVDEYNQRMAGLDSDEQTAILDIAAKRYVANVDRVIFHGKLNTRRLEIDAEDAEWDAKIAALASDQAAVETIQARLIARQKEVAARITTLQAAIQEEAIALEYADTEVSEKELAVEKAETGIVRQEAEITRKGAEITQRTADLANKDVTLSAKDLEISEKSLQVLKTQLAEAEAEQKILDTNLDVSRIQLQVIEGGIKSLSYRKEAAQVQIQNARTLTDIAKTDMIRVDLSNAQIEQSMAKVSNEEKYLRVAQTEEDITRTSLKARQVDNEYVDVNRQVANAKMDKARIDEKTSETDVLTAQAAAETARYNGEVDSLDLYDSKIAIINSDKTLLETETTNAGTELTNVGAEHDANLSVDNARHQARLEDAEQDNANREAGYDEQVRAAEKDLEITEDSRGPLEELKDSDIDLIEAKEDAQEKKYEVELEYLDDMMAAEITTTLSHSIGIA